MNIREHSGTKRRAVGFVIVGQELVFEFGHVHIGWTLSLAAFAFKAEVERLVQLLAREFFRRKFSIQNFAHEVGAAACGMLVFERHHV